MRHTLLLLFSFCCILRVEAQVTDSSWSDPGYDTSYIQSFRDDFVVTLVSSSCVDRLSVSDTLGKNITFATNLPAGFGFGLDYKWLTLEYTSTFGRTGPVEKGYTKMNNIGFGLTMRKFWFKNFYQETQGYYLTNPAYFNPDFNPAKDNYPFRNDVRTSVYYATLNYGFNHRRFSNIAAIWQLERQKKSAGTFTAGLTYSMANYASDSALFAKKYSEQFDSAEAITDFAFRLYGLNAGYLHTFAFTKSRKWFLSITLIPGISLQQGKIYSARSQEISHKQALGAHMESRVVTGYNGDRWYAAITAIAYAVSSDFEGINPFSQGYSFGRISVGYKFKMKPTQSRFLKRLGL